MVKRKRSESVAKRNVKKSRDEEEKPSTTSKKEAKVGRKRKAREVEEPSIKTEKRIEIKDLDQLADLGFNLSVKELKKKLETQGLSSKGTKDMLQNRLRACFLALEAIRDEESGKVSKRMKQEEMYRDSERLRFDKIVRFNAKALPQILRFRPSLSSIEISFGNNVTNETLQVIAQNCPKLQRLSLHACVGRDIDLTGSKIDIKGIQHITQNCRELKVIELDSTGIIGDEVVDELTSKLKELKCINLWGQSTITDKSLHMIGDRLPGIEALWFSAQFSNEAIQYMIERCPFIHTLVLDYCSGITEKTVEMMTKCLPALTLLGVKQGWEKDKVTIEKMQQILNAHPISKVELHY